MYKETLPPNCPFSEAIEQDKMLYRIFCENPASEKCFVPFIQLNPHRADLKENCKAYGLSFFDSKEVAIQYARRNSTLGAYVAKVDIKCLHGKLMLTNKKNGHYTLWRYKDFEVKALNCIIELIPSDVAV